GADPCTPVAVAECASNRIPEIPLNRGPARLGRLPIPPCSPPNTRIDGAFVRTNQDELEPVKEAIEIHRGDGRGFDRAQRGRVGQPPGAEVPAALGASPNITVDVCGS